MNYKQMLEAALKRAGELSKASGERDLTDDEMTEVKALPGQIADLKSKITAAEEGAALLKQLGQMGQEAAAEKPDDVEAAAKSLGEHFAKHFGPAVADFKGRSGVTFGAPEFKASSDTQVTGGYSGVFGPVLTDVDRTIVHGVRTRLTLADLLGSGSISGSAITYFVEGAVEGGFTQVSEGGQKPQIHVADPTAVTDALYKIAAFLEWTDEMLEDLDFVVSDINQRGLYLLGLKEEDTLLNSSSGLKGILQRVGIGTLTGASVADNPDTIFKAMTKVTVDSGLDPDGIMIHPTDYQALRLSKDSNNQYYGGGFFAGQYGNGTLTMQPPLWGLRTVVSPSIAAGTVLVGAFSQAATLYRKGGVRVESTNSHASNFTVNKVTTRIEERIALAVRVPKGFVKVTLADTDDSSSS